MKKMHEKILQNSPVPYAFHKIILDEKGEPCDYEFIEINDAFEEATGLSKETVIGNTISKIIPAIIHESFDWIGFYGKIALGGKPQNFEQFSEPLKKWFRVYAYSPEKYTFVTRFNDITREKEELTILDEFFSVNLDLLCIANIKGEFVKVNKEWENALGYSKEELEGKNFLELVHPDDVEETLKAISDLENQNQVLNFVNRYRTKNGTYRWIEWRSRPHDTLIYAAARDITEKIENEKKLKEQSRFLEKSLEFQELISEVSIIFNSKNPFEEQVQTVLEKLGKKLKVSRCYVFEDDEERTYTSNTFEWCSEGIKPQINELQMISYELIPSMKELLDKKGIICSDNIQKLPPDLRNVLEPQNIVSIVLFPLTIDKRIRGFLGFDECNRKRKWTEHELDVLETVSGILSRVFEKKYSNDRLLINKKRLENIVEATHVGTWEWNIQSGETVFNERWAEIAGYTLEEIKPLSIETWAKLAHPDDLNLSKNALENHFQGKTEFYEMEARMKHKDGSWVWVLDRGQVVEWGNDGKPLKMFGTHADITPRKNAEAESRRLTRAIEQASESVVITDLDANIVYVNPAFEKESGYAKEEVIGKNPNIIKSGKQDDSFYRELWDTISAGNKWEGEFINKRKNGELYYEEARLSPIFDTDGNITQYIALKHDITKQKKAEKELRSQQKLMDSLFRQSLDGFFFMMLEEPVDWNNSNNKDDLLDYVFQHQKITRVNQAILDQYKAKKEDFIGLSPSDFFEHNLEHGKKVWRKFFDEGKLHIDTEEKKLDGTTMIIEGDYICIYTDDGKIKGHFGIQREVTAERNAKKALEESEVNFRTFFETLGDMIFVADMDGKLIYTNSSTYKLGYQENELLGKKMIELHPERNQEEASEVLKKMLEGKQDTCSIPLETKDKKVLPVESRIWLGKWNHQDCIYGVSKDLSQIRSALDKFNRVFENNPALMSLSSVKDRTFINVNQAFLDKLKYQRDEVIGKKTTSLNLYASQEIQKIIYEKVVEEKKIRNHEVVVYDKNQKPIYGLFSGTIIPVQGDNVFLSVLVDITEQKKLEKDLMEAKEKAEAASRAKSEFLANMSHEIRTPLNGVIGFSEVLTRTKLSEQQKQYMKTVHSSAVLLMDIINDILDFSKIEAGKLQLNPEKMDLIEMIESVEDIIKHRAQEKKLEILLSYPANLPRYVIADPVRLRQVLVNLLGNAVKFTDKGEIELRVELQNKDNFTFSVRDTGIGISPKVQDKIFESFSQADLSTTRKYGGTGLGLSISNKLLEKMDSRLELESELGKGSRFFFSLKLEHISGEKIELKVCDEPMRALIVDDNKRSREILSEVLKVKEIEMETAENGIEALQKLEKDKFDIVLIDQEMPYMSGIEIIKNIREKIKNNKNIQIILMDNYYGNNQLQARLKKLDVQYLLEKPLKLWNLEKLINKALGLSEHESIEPEGPLVREERSFLGYSILVAEDNQVNLFLAETLIAQFLPGAQIIKTENGLETVEKFIEEQPDLILMDIQMPELNGYDATRQIRKYNEENGTYVPIIALTAGAVKGEKERCLEAGMDDFLAKPIHAEKLENILNHFLGQKLAKRNKEKRNKENLHFDKKSLIERLDEDMKGYEILVKMSLSTLEKKRQEYEKLGINKDINKLKHWIHSLKGTALTMNFNYLADLSGEMEIMDLTKVSEIHKKWELIKDEIEKVCLILKNEIESF